MSQDWSARISDVRRLGALLSTRLLDSEAEESYDRLTRLCAELLRSPVTVVSFIDEKRQFIKSAFGLGEPYATTRVAPLSHSFCKYVVASGNPLIVEDARQSPMLRDNPAVKESGVVAYAGVPLTSGGESIGAFCAVDSVPHAWSDEDIRILRALASAVESQIAAHVAHAELALREKTLDAVLTTMPAGVLIRDVAGAVVRTNPALEKLLGRSASVLLATDFWAITHPDDVASDAASREALMDRGERVAARIKRYRHADGSYVWVRLSAAVLRDVDGTAQGTVAVVEDVSAERKAAEALARQALIYQAIARNIPRGAVFLFDRDLRYLAADGPELFAAIGMDKSQIEGKLVREVALPEHVERVEMTLRDVLAGESHEFESRRAGRVLHTRVAPVHDGDRVVGGVALVVDVTEDRQRAAAVRRSNALFEATLANIRDGVALLNADKRVMLANSAYADFLNLPLEETVGLTRDRFMVQVKTLAEDPEAFERGIELLGPDLGAESTYEFVLVKPRRRHVRRTRSSVELPEGPGHLVVWQDITAEVELLAERERLALTDALTGIPNRRAGEQALLKAIALAERGNAPLSVAIFDIDHFKRVNDLHGHATGDEVLKRVAHAIDSAKRMTDTVARWGGEEFLAVLPVSPDGAVAFCERVRQEIASLRCPGIGRVTISAGVASMQANEGRDGLLARADQRLYAAKASGRDRVES